MYICSVLYVKEALEAGLYHENEPDACNKQ
jgi:hypothetical protein